TQATTKAAEFRQVRTVLNVLRGCVAVNHNRFVPDQRTGSFVVSPYSTGFRVSRRAAEDSPEHVKSRLHPVVLVDCCCAVALDAGNEEHHQDALSATAE